MHEYLPDTEKDVKNCSMLSSFPAAPVKHLCIEKCLILSLHKLNETFTKICEYFVTF